MTEATSTGPQEPNEKPVMRIAVSKEQPAGPTLLAMLVISRREDGTFTLQAQAQSDDILAQLTPILQPFRFKPPSAPPPNDLPDAQELIDMLATHGLSAQVVPLGDAQIQVQFDLRSGRVVGTHQSMHAFADPQGEIGQRVFAALSKSFAQACDDLASNMATALDQGDVEAASRALEAGATAIAISGTSRLLAVLERMDASKLTGDDRKRLLDFRFGLSQKLKRYDIGARDAEQILREERASLSDDAKVTLKMAIALGALHRGNKEAGLAQLRNLLADPSKLSPEQRGWAWRNLSIALDDASPEARRAAQLSADAFLEAGLKTEASRSSKGLVDALMNENPEEAIASLSASIALTDQESLGDRPVYASALQVRAHRLLTLGRFEDALRDAKASADVLRGLMGTEEDLVAALHLAAVCAAEMNATEEADRLEDEAAAITRKHNLSHFQLTERLTELSDTFDDGAAEALLKDAEAAGNIDVAVSVRVIRANGAPGLDATQRLALLEEILNTFRGKARAELLNMVKASIGIQLRYMSVFDRAATWFQEVFDAEPLNAHIRDSLIDCLWKSEQWSAAAHVIRKALDIRGDAPGLLYAYAKSLFESGNLDGALTAAQKSIKLNPDNKSELHVAATELRDAAIEAGGKLERKAEKPQANEVTREEFESALHEFSRFISAKKRMSFWRLNEKKERVWTSSPERHAQNLLHTYLQAKFGNRVEIFEELDTGAGRLDLYVKLKGGLAVVLELKMCGGGYASNYAASGETQIAHYMDNRDTHLGYLVVFDARVTKQAGPLLSKVPRYTIIELFVDVRPEVS